MKKLTLLFVMLCTSAIAQDTIKSVGFISVNTAYTSLMMEANQDLRKNEIFFNSRKDLITQQGITAGLCVLGIMDYQQSSEDSKFAYLMRHPTAANQIGKEVSEAVIHSFQLSLTGVVNNWMAAYGEMLYNPEQSFGTGSITASTRNLFELRKGYLAFGNLNSFPVYGTIGKMDAPFGQTGSVNPFSNSSMWHAFAGLGYGAQLSFMKWGINANVMAVQGGAQFRAMNTVVGDSSNVPSKLNNFVGDLSYTLKMGKKSHIRLGGSYLHGSAYSQNFPITHFAASKKNNPAVTGYGNMQITDHIYIMGAYATTLHVWPGTHNPYLPLAVYPTAKVSSIDAGAKYTFHLKGKVQYTVSGEFSNFRAGADGSPWERQNQIIAGFMAKVNHSRLFLEIFRTDGYTPLNFISGSNPGAPFPAGTTHSVRDAFSNGIVIGGQFNI